MMHKGTMEWGGLAGWIWLVKCCCHGSRLILLPLLLRLPLCTRAYHHLNQYHHRSRRIHMGIITITARGVCECIFPLPFSSFLFIAFSLSHTHLCMAQHTTQTLFYVKRQCHQVNGAAQSSYKINGY